MQDICYFLYILKTSKKDLKERLSLVINVDIIETKSFILYVLTYLKLMHYKLKFN